MSTYGNRNSTLKSFSIILLVCLCLSGCAAADKQLSRNDLKPINSMKIARLNSPPLLKETTGSTVAGVTGMMFGAIGGGIGGAIQYKMMENNGKELQKMCNLPDYSDQVFNILVDRIPKEVAGWPQIIVTSEPISSEADIAKDYVLLLKVKYLKVKDGIGLSAVTTATLRDPQGNILWEKNVKYETKKFDRQCDLDILEADNGKLLHEEYAFSIENTVSTIIKDLNGDSPKI